MNKTFKYKGFVCYWNKEERYELYSKEEWGYGKGYRTPPNEMLAPLMNVKNGLTGIGKMRIMN